MGRMSEPGAGLLARHKEQRPALSRRLPLVTRLFAPAAHPRDQDAALPLVDLGGGCGRVVARRRRPELAIALSLIACVLLPMLCAGIYLFAVASDQYVAESRFAVRKAEAARGADAIAGTGTSLAVTSLFSGGNNLGGENAEIIANYIHSRAIIDDVSQTLDLKAIFRRPEADAWARLPDDATAETMTAYWNGMVSVYVEISSGIVQVSVRAFRREDALALAQAILAASETLANSLTLKMQADQTGLAEAEVHRSEERVRSALADLTAYRDAQHLIDPVQTSTSAGKLLLQLMSDKIETEGRIYLTQQTQGPNAPGIAGTKARLQSIDTQLAALREQLAGQKQASTNMAATISRFEELELKKGFAEKMFDFAREGLERAQLAARGQSIYLAVFMPPSLPEAYSYPQRVTDFFLIALGAVMTWISGATIVASILDHRL